MSAEVEGLRFEIGRLRSEGDQLRAENERLRGLFKELRAAWFKGGDLDKDHVSQEALRIFIEAERGHQQLEKDSK